MSFVKKRWGAMCLLCIGPHILFAESFTDYIPSFECPPYITTLSIGPSWTGGGKQQTFYVQPQTERTYTANKLNQMFVDGELFLGIQRNLSSSLQGRLGLALGLTSNATYSGDIWDDADPEFNNFTYEYQVMHSHLAVKGVLLDDEFDLVVTPYISGGLGIAFNYASSYTNTPTIPEAVTEPNFESHTAIGFTYSIGFGVQRALDEHWLIALGYEGANWGKNNLAASPDQLLGSGLALNHVYTNGLLFSISYQA